MKITGLGQCALDNLFLIDQFPERDTKKEVLQWSIAGGGPVATALVSLARLGLECEFFGITGDDEAGDKIRESLRIEHIHIDGLLKRKGALSQVAFIAVEKGTGKRTIFWKRPSGMPMTPEELPHDFLENSSFLLLDGLMTEASIYAAKQAKEKGIPVMLDAGRVREGMLDLAHLCDYVVCSEEFAREFDSSGDPFDPLKVIMQMQAFGAKAATITLGDRGSVTVSKDDIFRVPAFQVETVDTTGAGDVFHGGYIYGLLQKWDIREVVRFASAFAALKCRKLGGRPGIATLSEVEQLLSADL